LIKTGWLIEAECGGHLANHLGAAGDARDRKIRFSPCVLTALLFWIQRVPELVDAIDHGIGPSAEPADLEVDHGIAGMLVDERVEIDSARNKRVKRSFYSTEFVIKLMV
jgi:hypothetical protein